MSNLEGQSGIAKLWIRIAGSLSAKLLALLVLSMVVVFGILGYLNIQLHRRHLEHTALSAAARMSSVIKRNTSYYMLRNQRDGLYHIITDMANEPGMVRIRIINDRGNISFSSDPSEMGMRVDRHLQIHKALPAGVPYYTYAEGSQSFRTYSLASGERALGVITPIENSPSCSAAECHAHPAEIKTLGVLDTSISLATTDQSVAESRRQVLLYTVLAIFGVAVLCVAFVQHMVGEPLKALNESTKRLGSGELGYQIQLKASGELRDVANSFNTMSRQLEGARREINAWTHTLEHRVEEKSSELRGAQEEMLRVERMASIGKLAAVVAHEINNPLAGILTYSKLLKKRLSREAQPDVENISMLDLMESESRRCGDIVKNLMTFARPTSMNREPADLNSIIDRCIRLVQHQLELKNIELHRRLDEHLPLVRCDHGQIEQVVLALVMNAIDAMPNGGNLTLSSRAAGDSGQVQMAVVDDGVGMPPDVVANMFEPFFTTKEHGRGLGLGLAISRNIVDRHGGQIDVTSEPGHGTAFTITLPLQSKTVQATSPVGAVG
jgi:two-component system NtrC family sensor kinase